MFVPFEKLPPTARVWIFQANRPLTTHEINIAERVLREFTDQWAVHGSPFETSYAIEHRQFIIFAADERMQSASGCSIDSSVRVLKGLEQEFGIQLFDRSQVAFLLDQTVALIPVSELKEKFKNGTLNGDSLSFNNLVNTKKDLEEGWVLPAGQTWLKRYLPNPLAKVK